MTARWWEYINGDWVKLSLRPEHVLEWERHHRHEEGYTLEMCRWEAEGTKVIRTWYEEGRDCDGRLDRECVTWCPYSQLKSNRPTKDIPKEILRPNWQIMSKSQRDYAAEAAGY